jgi:hypothetical protein
MKASQFNIGSVVTLNSTSPKMTITSFSGTAASQIAQLTFWDNHAFTFTNTSIPVAALTLEPPKVKK